jgi:hypothetical protein
MADTRPTKVTFCRAVHLCVLLLFAPKRFLAEENAEDSKLRSERIDKQLLVLRWYRSLCAFVNVGAMSLMAMTMPTMNCICALDGF